MSDSCNPMDCNTPVFPVLHYLPEFVQSCPFSQWCNPTISSSVDPFSSYLQSFPVTGSFPLSQLSISGGLSIGAWASASVLPMNIQGWFPLELIGLISLRFKGLSRVFSSTTIRKHKFFSVHPSFYGPTLTSVHNYRKNHSFDSMDLCRLSDVSAF